MSSELLREVIRMEERDLPHIKMNLFLLSILSLAKEKTHEEIMSCNDRQAEREVCEARICIGHKEKDLDERESKRRKKEVS